MNTLRTNLGSEIFHYKNVFLVYLHDLLIQVTFTGLLLQNSEVTGMEIVT
jgi:hypothetical protein